MATIRIPSPMRRYTNGERQVTVAATTLAAAIEELDRRFPGLSERLLDRDGNLHHFVNVFIDEQDVRLLQGLATPLAEKTEVSIIPAMAGGCRIQPPIAAPTSEGARFRLAARRESPSGRSARRGRRHRPGPVPA